MYGFTALHYSLLYVPFEGTDSTIPLISYGTVCAGGVHARIRPSDQSEVH